ncbi:MAG: DMT family transporter [Myxococcota bacterium]
MNGPDAETATRRRVRVALLVAVVAIGFAAIFFRETAPTHPLVAAGWRLALAGLLLAPAVARAAGRGEITGRVARAGAVAGLCYGVHFGAWVSSLHLTSVAASVTLVTATPLLLGVVGWASGRDRPTGRLWLALSIAAVGVAIIASGHGADGGHAVAGDALAVLGAAAMAGYLLAARSQGPALPVWGFLGIATSVGGVLLLGTAAAADITLVPSSARAAGFIVAATLLPQLVGHAALTWALRHAKPTLVGLATVGEPAVASLLAWVWLGEAVTGRIALGCAFTLAAVVLALRSPASAPRPAR